MSEANDPTEVLAISVPEGKIRVKVGKGEPGDVDIITAWNRWCELADETRAPGDTDHYSQFVKELGLGEQHNRAEAFAFVKALREQVEKVKKKAVGDDGGDAPSSPGDTGSTAST